MAGEGIKGAPSTTEIRRARLRAGLTQADAAELVHVKARMWRYWENGKHGMPVGTWELFGVKLAKLAEGRA